jgi:hypothetical protein
MSSAPLETLTPPSETAEPGMSPLERAVAVFTSPANAWRGLTHQVQFWFPMALLAVCMFAMTAVLWERSYLPDATVAWQEAVDNGQMTSEQLDKMERTMVGPGPRFGSAAFYAVTGAAVLLIGGLATWFGVGFILGTKFSYRLALEVAAWSWLVQLPGLVITAVLGWFQQSIRDVHLGLSVLLPAAEEPGKLLLAARAFLDFIGPFPIWSLVVSILGAAALSGAPRRSVAWVCIGLHLVFALFMAGIVFIASPSR